MDLRNKYVLAAALLTAFLALGGMGKGMSNDSPPDGEPQIRILKKSRLAIDSSVEVWIREHFYQPGWTAPTHFHNSDLFIYVVDGAFEVTTEEEGRNVYTTGMGVLMKPNLVMDARNASDTDALKLSVVQIGEVDKPFVVPVKK